MQKQAEVCKYASDEPRRLGSCCWEKCVNVHSGADWKQPIWYSGVKITWSPQSSGLDGTLNLDVAKYVAEQSTRWQGTNIERGRGRAFSHPCQTGPSHLR